MKQQKRAGKKSDAGLIALSKRFPILTHMVLIILAIVALSVVAHVVMLIATRHNSHRTVPDFTGISYDDAKRLAVGRELRLHINDSLFVTAFDGGIVLDQLPEAGTTVKKDRTIYITINAYGQRMVEVPYVAGRSLRQAKNMLEIAGLGIEELVYTPDMATNFVLEQWCDGAKMEKGDKIQMGMGRGVTLYVGAEEHSRSVTPKVIGLPLRMAKSRLWESGFNVGKVEFDDNINRLNRDGALVCMQSEPAGRARELGTAVSLHLSLDTARIGAASRQSDADLKEYLRHAEGVDSLAIDSLAADIADSLMLVRLAAELEAEFFDEMEQTQKQSEDKREQNQEQIE